MATLGPLPSSHQVAESYAVVPSLAHPRLLLPVGARRGVAASLTRLASPQSLRARALGAVAGAAWRTGLGDLAARTRLSVGIDRRVAPDQWEKWLILRHLEAVLEGSGISAVIPVKRATPNSKPTVRLIRSGEVFGYAKLGWSNATRGLVANEAQVLGELDGGVRDVSVPRLVAHGEWQNLNYLVTAPLTDRLGSFLDPPETVSADLLAISHTGDRETTRVQGSAYFRGLQTRLASASAGEPDVAAALSTWLARVPDRSQPLEFGRWHGDWVSWNLGRTEHGIVVWDWEYSARLAPLGFDLLHWHFQRRLALSDGSLAAAVAAVDAASPSLSSLRVPPNAHGLLVSLYLIEVLTRAALLASQGSGWNPRLHPDLLRLAASRGRPAG